MNHVLLMNLSVLDKQCIKTYDIHILTRNACVLNKATILSVFEFQAHDSLATGQHQQGPGLHICQILIVHAVGHLSISVKCDDFFMIEK